MAIATALWLASAPLLTSVFVALVVLACVVQHPAGTLVALVSSAVLVLLLRLRLASAGARARILSGHSPFGCFSAAQTPEALTAKLCAVWDATRERPSIVGSGWGWFIGRAFAPRAVFTHRLKGRVNKTTFWAGTELRDVEAALRQTYGRTFWSTPTMQRISIGSWLARSCHGNSGAAGKPSSYAAERVYVIDMETRATTARGPYWEDYKEAKVQFDANPERYVVVAVAFEPTRMTNDQWLQKMRTDVRPDYTTASQGLREWLTAEAVLRVLFFGSARSELAIGVTYVPFDEDQDPYPTHRQFCGCCGREVKHVDPHDCSASLMSLQLDTCSLVCGWYEQSKRVWRGIIKLSDANAFSPDPSWLGFPIISLLSGTVNYELIFVLPHLVAPTPRTQELRVQKLCNALFKVYKEIWGRSELRMANLDKGLVFVDCITRERDIPVVLKELKPHMHLQTVGLHDGKFQGDSVARAITDAQLWRETPRAVFKM